MTADELGALLMALLSERSLTLGALDIVCLGSVAPALTQLWLVTCAAHKIPLPLLAADLAPQDLGLSRARLKEVGADRLANVVAARQAAGAPAIVIDFGTATTIDVVDARGRFIGGVISAGLEISAEALYTRAARLDPIELNQPLKRLVARTTEEALRVGLVAGEAAKVDGLVERIADELGAQVADLLRAGKLPVLATGGLAALVAPHSRTITACDENLTLTGLKTLVSGFLTQKRV